MTESDVRLNPETLDNKNQGLLRKGGKRAPVSMEELAIRRELEIADNKARKRIEGMQRYILKNIYKSNRAMSDELESYIDDKADSVTDYVRDARYEIDEISRRSKIGFTLIILMTMMSFATLMLVVHGVTMIADHLK